MIKAVIFDLDGTLVSFKIDYMSAREKVDSYLLSKGVPASLLGKKPIFTTLEKAVSYLSSRGVNSREIENIRSDVERIVYRFEEEAAAESALLPGVKETLSKIRDLGLKIGLFTLNNREITERVLKSNSIIEFFDAVVTRNDSQRLKPHRDHFLKVVGELNVKADETVIVGDTIYDFLAAKDLGAVCVGVLGLYSEDRLRKEGRVDFVIPETSKVLDVIKNLLKNKNV